MDHQPSLVTVSGASGRKPGLLARVMIALAIVVAVLAQWLGRFDDPPSPFDDSAVRNLTTLVSCCAGGLTIWFWFCFRSSYSRKLRLGVATVSVIAGLATVV